MEDDETGEDGREPEGDQHAPATPRASLEPEPEHHSPSVPASDERRTRYAPSVRQLDALDDLPVAIRSRVETPHTGPPPGESRADQ